MRIFSKGSICAAPALCVALAACSGGDPAKPNDKGGDGRSPTAAISYYPDIAPVIEEKCGACHKQGGIAPIALTTYADVLGAKEAIKGAIASGAMPPWPPAKGCGEYLDDRSLSDAQRATITGWIDAGAPEGDPKSARPAAQPAGGMSRVDVTVGLPEAYTPKQSPDDYRCFLVDWPKADTTYVTGLGVAPGNAAIVHHVIAFLAKPDQVDQYQQLDDADPGPGYTCFGGPGASKVGAVAASWLGWWAPGVPGSDFPQGTGIEVPAGSKLVLQIHYNTSTAAATADATKVQFKVDPTVEKKASVIPFTDPTWILRKTMIIPAHTTNSTVRFMADLSPLLGVLSQGVLESDKPFTLHSASLHMHTHGTQAVTSILRDGGGDECMLQIDKWNFHWQGAYGFTQPKQVNPGDRIYLECHYDNPGSTDLTWGEGTGDEMCMGSYYVTQ